MEKVSLSGDSSEVVKIEGETPLYRIAELFKCPVGTVICELLKKGMPCNKSDILSVDVIKDLADVLEKKIVVEVAVTNDDVELQYAAQIRTNQDGLVKRWPVAVVMGHVDHGKTTLLDFLRKSSVAEKEKGGITQHLAAYEVDSTHGRVVFLDTPGHAAFKSVRGRGVSVTDIIILVVAVDDGIKPQTIEVIKHAQSAKLPMIVAINKIDKAHKPDDIERVKRQLAEHDVLVEGWGGETVIVPISAKTGKGVEELLEMIVLQTQMMNIVANPAAPVRAFVLESRVDRGYGPIATVIPLEGTLRQGDYFAAEGTTGKVRLLIKSSGEKVKEAGPSVPVQVVGFNCLPAPGSLLEGVTVESYSRSRTASTGAGRGHQANAVARTATAVGDVDIERKMINVIIKADAQGSSDAISHLIKQLGEQNPDFKDRLQIIYQGVGDITESDVIRAANIDALLIGFFVKNDRNAIAAAQDKGVKIKSFDVIYHLTEFLEDAIKRTKYIAMVWKKVGTAEVRKVFVLKDRGIIAGCYVSEGNIQRVGKVVCLRNEVKVGEDKIASLQRNKKNMKEVAAGYECAFICEKYHDWQIGDFAECYVETKGDA